MGILDYRHKINKYLRKASTVFIVAHQDLDLDALGSSVGMYELLIHKRKKCFLVTNDKKNELGVEKVLSLIKDQVEIISTQQVKDNLDKNNNKNLLIILDTNKPFLLPSEDLLKLIDNHIVIDHHDENQQSIKDGLIIIDTNASSTSEMITELIASYNMKTNELFSTILLSGIVLDTNNFILKTTAKTYFTAYYLTNLGADPRKVQYLLKQDLKQYIERQKTITDVKIIYKNIALAVSPPTITYRREDLAKIADTLLLFNEIECSFVIGKIAKNTIGISARSMGNIAIQNILEPLGGGGDTYNAAAKIENSSIDKIERLLKKQISLQRTDKI